MIHINEKLITETSTEAKNRPRQRMNLNFHKEDEDRLQRMLNAIEPGSYICPHKHENPDKREAFFILRGRIAVIEFNNQGDIEDYTILSVETGNYGVEIPPRTWHSLVSLEPDSVAYEVKDGPYNPENDKVFAQWAPAENAPEAANYLKQLEQKISK